MKLIIVMNLPNGLLKNEFICDDDCILLQEPIDGRNVLNAYKQDGDKQVLVGSFAGYIFWHIDSNIKMAEING